jgi:hypothetical protein
MLSESMAAAYPGEDLTGNALQTQLMQTFERAYTRHFQADSLTKASYISKNTDPLT